MIARGLAAALAALALCAAPQAAAQAATLDQLAGEWAVETAPHRFSGCVIAGRATARRAESGESLAITLRVTETCPDMSAVSADQTCTAQLKDAGLIVRCVLEASSSPNYLPDQFMLSRVTARAMSGTLIDAGVWREPVQWRRPAPALVS